MASPKEYAYYIESGKIALLERDVTFNNDETSRDYGPGVDRGMWKSPKSTVADGLKIQYTYAPEYHINRTDVTHTDVAKYRATSGGKLQLRGPDGTNYDSTMDVGNYIVLSNAGKFNGLHKINSFANGGGTNDIIELDTSYSGANSSWTNFEKTVTMYYDVSPFIDESFYLDLPPYLEQAIIFYLKAVALEDIGKFEGREYYMKLFRKRIERFNDTRHSGPRMVASGPNAII